MTFYNLGARIVWINSAYSPFFIVTFFFSFSLQLLDLPGIIEGAKDGKGRGKQVIAGTQS